MEFLLWYCDIEKQNYYLKRDATQQYFASAFSDKGGPVQKKEEITISKNLPLAIFCINRTANECYDLSEFTSLSHHPLKSFHIFSQEFKVPEQLDVEKECTCVGGIISEGALFFFQTFIFTMYSLDYHSFDKKKKTRRLS